MNHLRKFTFIFIFIGIFLFIEFPKETLMNSSLSRKLDSANKVTQIISDIVVIKNGSPFYVRNQNINPFDPSGMSSVFKIGQEFYAKYHIFDKILNFSCAYIDEKSRFISIEPIKFYHIDMEYFSETEITFLKVTENRAQIYKIPPYTMLKAGFYKDDVTKYFCEEKYLMNAVLDNQVYPILEILSLLNIKYYVYDGEFIFISNDHINDEKIEIYQKLFDRFEVR